MAQPLQSTTMTPLLARFMRVAEATFHASTMASDALAIRPAGLSDQDRQHFARRLLGADLAAEQKKAQALITEASAERQANPARGAQLEAVARDRLSLIYAERKARASLAVRLSDGTSLEAFAKSLTPLPTPDLQRQEQALRTVRPATGDAQAKLTVVTRELQRREAAAENQANQQEQARLTALKQQYTTFLKGLTPEQLSAEQAQQARRSTAARQGLEAAKTQLRMATPDLRAQAELMVKQAEAQVRMESARAAVLQAQKPGRFDRPSLHVYADTLKPLGRLALMQERRKVADELQQMTTGAIRATRDDVATQKAKVAIVDQAIARLPQPTRPTAPSVDAPKKAAPEVTGPQKVGKTHPAAGAPVFKEPGVFVWHTNAFPADIAIQRLKAQGVKWVAVQIADGTTMTEETVQALQAGYLQKLHQAGIKVGFWSVNRTEPEAEARLMASEIKKWGADFYIANAELEYKYSQAEGFNAETFGRSKRFIDTFRRELPNLPASVSSFGRADLADIDWKAWQAAGFDWMPQAYLNEFDIYDPALCVEAGVKAGWPKDQIHPTLGTWGGGQKRIVSVDEYAASLRKGGSVGFSTYLAEQMSEADWAQLGQAIAKGDLAR